MTMKRKTGNSITLGIFVTAGIALFIFGIYRIGSRRQLFNTSFRVSCIFSDVNGLQAGNNVRFAGITVGTVDNIRIINDSSVKVDALIDVSTKPFIKKDAIASIGAEGLMGNKILIVSPGNGAAEEIGNNDFIQTAVPITIDDIMIRLRTSTENIAHITDDVLKLTRNIREGKGAIGRLFMDSTLERNLSQSMQNIREGSSGFKTNMESAKKSFFLKPLFRDRNKKENGDNDEKKNEKKNGDEKKGK